MNVVPTGWGGVTVGRREEVRRAARAYAHGADNARVVVTGADPRDCVPTIDPWDHAHLRFDPALRLTPAADAAGNTFFESTPRAYHLSQLAGRVSVDGLCGPVVIAGLTWETRFDAWDIARRALESQGVPMGGSRGGGSGVGGGGGGDGDGDGDGGGGGVAEAQERALAFLESMGGRLADRLRRPAYRVRVPKREREAYLHERALAREATRLIEKARGGVK